MVSTQESSQGNPFGAVSESGIAFLLPEQMRRVAADYHADKTNYRVQHLPLVVGKFGPDLMQAINTLHPYGENFPSLIDCETVASAQLRDGLLRNNFIEQAFSQQLGSERAASDIKAYAAIAARVVCGIAAFDAQHFGHSQQTRLRFEHGVITPTEGLHYFRQQVVWHRDYETEATPAMDGWRAYMYRTKHPAYFAQGAANGDKIFQPAGGEVVLYAVGANGNVHCSHRPSPPERIYPSLFSFMIQQP